MSRRSPARFSESARATQCRPGRERPRSSRVAASCAFGDPVVGSVRAGTHDDALDERISRHGHEAVGDHMDLDPVALSHAVDLRFNGAGVSIDIDLNWLHW